MTTFALSRVTYLVGIAVSKFAPGLTPAQVQQDSVQAYFAAGIQVIDEMLLIGAAICLIALVPALWFRGSGRAEAEDLAAERRLEHEPTSGR
jgi:hypothetical protein